MTIKKTDLAASLGRESRRGAAVPVATGQAPEATGERLPSAVVSGGKVRLTVDLVRPEFRDFRRWREDQAETLDRGRVTAQDVLRILVRQLLSDEELQRRVMESIRAEGQHQ